jgi:AAHS family 4-hydroxybenzoate transporter-like MFS transporter
VLGVLVCSAVVTAMGSRRPVLFAALSGATTALLLTLVHIGAAGSHALLIAAIGINGFFVNSVQTSLFALAAHVYPTSVRATGVACATAMGRCGGILSSLAGAAIIQAGAGTFLTALAVAMGAAFVSLAIVRRHY